MRLMSATVAVSVTAMLVLSVCMFMSPSSRSPLEARAEAEADVLRLVPRVFLQRGGIVYTDWPEGRYPLDADARRNPHGISGEHGVAVRRPAAEAPQRADIHEGLAEDADLLGQSQREAELGRGGIEVGAAERVRRVRIARSDAADLEAAQRIAADEEQVVEPERRAVVGEHRADRAADGGDDVLHDALVVTRVSRRAVILLRADQARHRIGVARQEALGRVDTRVARIPGQRL